MITLKVGVYSYLIWGTCNLRWMKHIWPNSIHICYHVCWVGGPATAVDAATTTLESRPHLGQDKVILSVLETLPAVQYISLLKWCKFDKFRLEGKGRLLQTRGIVYKVHCVSVIHPCSVTRGTAGTDHCRASSWCPAKLEWDHGGLIIMPDGFAFAVKLLNL